jgi:ABC-type glycerol-3-phosphate transport system substrate-binding protein
MTLTTRHMLAVLLIALLGLTACAQEATPEATETTVPTDPPAVETVQDMDMTEEATAEMTEITGPTETPGTSLDEEMTEDAVDVQATPGSDEDDIDVTVEPREPTSEATEEATEEMTEEATEEMTEEADDM